MVRYRLHRCIDRYYDITWTAGNSSVLAGSVNGLILPITLLVILLASRRKDIVGEDYKHPTVLIVLGVCVVLLTGYSGIKALPKILTIFG